MKLKVHDVSKLIDIYGANATLEDILKKIQGDKVYKCPKCNGLGAITEEYNGYPSGLPDSDFIYKAAYRHLECDLCKGEGFTTHQYKPKMIQDGWE